MDWSPQRVLEWFVAPARGFADGAPVRVAAGVVLVLCVLNALLVSQAAVAVADATVGTTQVDNPARPSDDICQQAADGEDFEHLRDDCATEPETVTREYASAARDSVNGLVGLAFVAPLAAWLLLSGLFTVSMGGRSHDDPSERVSYSAVLAVTGVGLAPAALRYLARTVVVERTVADGALTPTSLPAARTLALDAMTPETLLYGVVVAASVAWSAFIWREGLRAAFDRESRALDLAVGFAAVLLGLQAVYPVFLGFEPVGAGVVLVLLGLPALLVPRLFERLDLFVSLLGTRGSVELKPWRVLLAQVGGLAFVLAGTALVGALAFA